MSDTAKCGRLARSTGLPCGKVAGHGTDHKGTGACSTHGGSSKGAPKGNKNALKTGEYETLYYSALTENERQLWGIGLNARTQAEHNLRLICIRVHRILIRINEAIAGSDDDGLEISSISSTYGWQGKQGKANFSVTERRSVNAHVAALEESLTRLQGLKVRAIDQLRLALKDGGGGEDRLQSLVDAIDRSAANLGGFTPSDPDQRDA